jgi:hypothetical protein
MLCCGLVEAGDYESRLAAALARCEQIPAMESHTGLIFNPDGYRSYYGRSACYQRLAVDFRDADFCEKVYRRYALFSSSWGYSEKNCRRLVREAVVGDRAEIERLKDAYSRAPVLAVDFKLQRNGNGRDFDLKPVFTDGFASGYSLEFLLLNSANEWISIYKQGVHLGSSEQRLNFYIKKGDIVALLPEFDDGQTYLMALDIIAAVPMGRGNARWPEAWLEQVWPQAERSQRLTRKQGVVEWRPM